MVLITVGQSSSAKKKGKALVATPKEIVSPETASEYKKSWGDDLVNALEKAETLLASAGLYAAYNYKQERELASMIVIAWYFPFKKSIPMYSLGRHEWLTRGASACRRGPRPPH